MRAKDSSSSSSLRGSSLSTQVEDALSLIELNTSSISSTSTIIRSLTEIAHVDDEIDAEAHKKLDTFIDSVGAHAAAWMT